MILVAWNGAVLVAFSGHAIGLVLGLTLLYLGALGTASLSCCSGLLYPELSRTQLSQNRYQIIGRYWLL